MESAFLLCQSRMSYTNNKPEIINNQIKFVKKVTFNRKTSIKSLLSQVSGTSTWLVDNSKKKDQTVTETRKVYSRVRIAIPKNIKIYVKPMIKGSVLFISGARGLIYLYIPENTYIFENGDGILNIYCDNTRIDYPNIFWIKNLYRIFVGVNRGYKKYVNIVGVGYKSFIQDGNIFKFVLGYSHEVYYKLNNKLNVLLGRKNNKFIMRGTSLPLISTVTATVHTFKKPDIYRGKGLRYRGVALPFKEGKKKK